MAEFVVSNLAEDVLGTLQTLLSQENFDVSSVGSRMLRELEGKIRAIKDVLPDAEKKQSSSPMVCVWLRKVKAALLEAEEVCDVISYLELKEHVSSNFIKKVRFLVSSIDFIGLLPSATVRSIVILRRSLADIEKKRNGLDFKVEEELPEQTMSFVSTERVFGRQNEECQIVNWLTGLEDSDLGFQENISVVAIVGLGGMGKTTLAQFVFDNDKIKSHFQNLRYWVCVSGLSNEKKILMKIAKSVTGSDELLPYSVDQLHSLILKKIVQQRYLLVLDDLMLIDYNTWTSLRGLLNKGAKGSKILVTTRPEVVYGTSGIMKQITLVGLSDEGCWSQFQRIAFETVEASKEREQLGKEIVSRCLNVPLIVNLVANLFHEKSLNEWLQFRDEKIDLMAICGNKKNDVLKVLIPSYDKLEPAHLKHCFSYCSLFPVGYEFNKRDLIHQWIAQGFVKSTDNNYSLQDTGEKYFMKLVNMCFFQDVKRDALGDITSCKMHNMVHHLARHVAGSSSVMAFSDYTKVDDRTLHLSFRFDEKFSEALFRAHKLRTLILMKEPACRQKLVKSTCYMLISKFKCLRVLDLHDCGLDRLSNDVGDLIHLRYLDLSKNDSLVALPESITKLHNLQTLKLNYCQSLERLPKGIGKLVMLTCLEIDECDSLTYMPVGLRKLTHLQTLNRFVVCMPDFGDNTVGGIKVLNPLNNLRGKLKVELSGQWTTLVHEAPEANLEGKNYLTDLKIEWRLGGLDNNHTYYYYGALLEGFKPPCSLKALYIEGYKGKDFPSWARMDKLSKSLPNLVIISIEGCQECKHLPPFGQLKSLKRLTLRHMEGVQYVEYGTFCPSSSTTSYFPSLEDLTLHSFYNLKGWWKDVDETQDQVVFPYFPSLLNLKIWNCPKLASIPRFPFVEEVDFQNVNQTLLEAAARLQHVPNLKRLLIKACSNIKILPTLEVGDRCLIQYLVIDKCDKLTSLMKGLENLTSLQELEISHCKELNFEDFNWSSLKSLRILVFRGIPKMKSLPQELQQVKTLRLLSIATCGGLTALPEWIDQILPLQHLRMEACPKLTSLPLSIRNLKLDKLEIMECPELMESCREPNGKYWHYIKHIPQILLHKSWRYGLMNDAVGTQAFKATQSQSFIDRTQNQQSVNDKQC